MKHCSAIEPDAAQVIDIGFLCWDGLPLDQLSVGLAYLKAANQLTPDKQVRGSVLSFSGGNVQSACGVNLSTCRIDENLTRCRFLFLVGGAFLAPDQQAHLGRVARTQLRAGRVLGALDTALVPLARTGLLDGQDVAASAQILSALQEQFPQISPRPNDHYLLGTVWSAGAGFALLNLLSKVIGNSCSLQERPQLNRKFLSYRPHFGTCPTCARDAIRADSTFTGNGVVDKAIRLFRDNLEEPLQLTCVAREVGISLRQLERKFVATTGLTPKAFYLEERLEKAHTIVRFTNLALAEVALACGFGSYATLSQKYKQRFGRTPASERARISISGEKS